MILYQALGERIGLVLATNDPERLRQRFYAARRALNDPDLAHLQFRASPLADGDLVITKGERQQARPVAQALPRPSVEDLGL